MSSWESKNTVGVEVNNAKIADKVRHKVVGSGQGSTWGFRANGDFEVQKGGSFKQTVRAAPKSDPKAAVITTNLSGNKDGCAKRELT